VKGYLNNSFSMKDLGEASYILGIKIYRDRSRRLIGLSQSTYLDKILKKFRMDESKKGFLPMLPGKVLSKTQGPATAEERERMSQIPYASAVGSIMYAMLCTRPDIAHAVSLTSRYQSDPGIEHWTAVKNILKYLKRTKDMFLCYGGDQELVVTSYTDASWNTDPDDSKSQSGYVFILNGAAVSWASSKQCTVAKSSIIGVHSGFRGFIRAVWMKRFIVELGVVPSALDPLVIYCDNMGAIANAQEPRSHKRLKHIKLRYHSIREYIEDGEDKTLLDTTCSGSFTRNKEEFKWDLLNRIQENAEDWENDKGYADKPPFKPLPPKEGNEEKEKKKKKGTKKKKKKKKKKKENKEKEATAHPRVYEVTIGNHKYVAPNDYYDNESEYDDLPIPFTHVSDHDLEEHTTFDVGNLFGTDYESNDDSIIHVPSNDDIESSKLGDVVLEDPIFETSTSSENDNITYSGLDNRYRDGYDTCYNYPYETCHSYDWVAKNNSLNMQLVYHVQILDNNLAPITINEKNSSYAKINDTPMHMNHDKNVFSDGASNELWRIILEGYKPYNPDKLTRREEVDNQLNSIALHMIQTSVGTKDLVLVWKFTTAKEAWEGLAISFMGSESMKRNKYSALRNQAEGFMRLPDEDHQEMYRRLITIADAFRKVGAQHIDDFCIKDKYIDCMMPFEPIGVKSLIGREIYPSLTSQQVVHELQGLKVAEQNSLDSRNRAIGMTRDLEYHYNGHMAFHEKTFWVDPSKAKEDNIKRNNSSGFKNLGPRARSCYNCGDKRHFIAECPYEHRETHGGRLIPKDKSKDSKAPNKKFYNKSKKNKRPSRIVLMTKEEYSSDDNDSSSDEEETSKEVAAIATTNIPSSSLFESPNENPHIKNAHCFMASTTRKVLILNVQFCQLMSDRFEMSMMGEMRLFLGFEIKKLREGTFINQAKYLQDMLKRFKMTEMKGVDTPMITKCHLALDPNGK
ncbi:hypothetical protein QYE76_001062, partial [Lolium multiflorum]